MPESKTPTRVVCPSENLLILLRETCSTVLAVSIMAPSGPTTLQRPELFVSRKQYPLSELKYYQRVSVGSILSCSAFDPGCQVVSWPSSRSAKMHRDIQGIRIGDPQVVDFVVHIAFFHHSESADCVQDLKPRQPVRRPLQLLPQHGLHHECPGRSPYPEYERGIIP